MNTQIGINNNNNPRTRITSDNTYSGGTTILGNRQLIELGSSSVKSGATIISGPFGTGTVTETNDTGNDQTPFFVAWGADRTLDNPITLGSATASGTINFGSTSDDTTHTLTLTGDVTVPTTSASLVMNNAIGASGANFRNGTGDVNINGNVLLTGTGGTLLLGQGGASPSAGVSVGKLVINGNIQQSGGAYNVTIANGTAAIPTVVQLNGQNTFATLALSASGNATTTAAANVGIGSSTTLDGGGAILSGPLGLGLVTVSGAGNPAIEALGGARTVANPISLANLQTVLDVRGSNDLTLSGPISDFGGLSKDGSAKLTLTGTNGYIGATTVNSGTLLVNGSLSATSGVTVASGATLGGSGGAIAGPIANNGTIAPGASVGTLTASSDVTDGGKFPLGHRAQRHYGR